MKVVAHDPYVAPSLAQQLNITLAPLDEVYAQSDYITLHVGLTPQTQGMINADSIRKMKKGVRLVNCARGELLNEPAVIEALQSGQLGGAALDVYSNEPLKDSPLATMPNVILTPHIAGSTHEAQEAVGVQIALQVREYLTKGVIQNAVNVPSISEEEYQEMLPYIVLGERLGTFLAQSNEGGVEEMGLSYSGEIAGVEDGTHPQCRRGRRAEPDRSCSRAGEPGECCVDCRGAWHPPHRAQEDARRRRRCCQRASHDLQDGPAGKHGGRLRSARRLAPAAGDRRHSTWKRRWKATSSTCAISTCPA